MHKLSLIPVVALAATTISVPKLNAQSAPPPLPKLVAACSSGLTGGGPGCPLNRRLLIVVRRQGAGAPAEINEAVHMSGSGLFLLTPEQATAADSTLYAILDVKRDADGQYTVVESISGSRAKHPENCRAVSTGRLRDLAFGAFLATATTQLVRCAQHARPRIGNQ